MTCAYGPMGRLTPGSRIDRLKGLASYMVTDVEKNPFASSSRSTIGEPKTSRKFARNWRMNLVSSNLA